jgi:hypothetical protein
VIHRENPKRRIYGETLPLASKFILSEEALIFGDLAVSSDPQITMWMHQFYTWIESGVILPWGFED